MEQKIKKTTYHRLKEENSKLINDIRAMITEPTSNKAVLLILEYGFRFNQEDIIFYGESTMTHNKLKN